VDLFSFRYPSSTQKPFFSRSFFSLLAPWRHVASTPDFLLPTRLRITALERLALAESKTVEKFLSFSPCGSDERTFPTFFSLFWLFRFPRPRRTVKGLLLWRRKFFRPTSSCFKRFFRIEPRLGSIGAPPCPTLFLLPDFKHCEGLPADKTPISLHASPFFDSLFFLLSGQLDFLSSLLS